MCDNSKYVLQGENGFLFSPKDIDSKVLAFVQLFSLNDEEYKSFCCHSRVLTEQNLSQVFFINGYEKLIES